MLHFYENNHLHRIKKDLHLAKFSLRMKNDISYFITIIKCITIITIIKFITIIESIYI